MFHTVRNSELSTERTFLVSDRGLTVIAASGERINVAFQDIRKVRVRTNAVGCRTCVIATRSQQFVLSNRHFVRRGEFQDRSESFAGFLQALHERLQPYSANIRFTQGSNRLARMAVVMFVLVPVLYVAGLLSFSRIGAACSWTLYPALLVVPISLMGTLLPLMRSRRRKAHGPIAAPARGLPGTTQHGSI